MVTLAGCNQDSSSPSEGKYALLADRATFAANTQTAEQTPPAVAKEGVLTIDWDELIPKNYRLDPGLIDLYEEGKLSDDDPRMIELRRLSEALLEHNPVNTELAGTLVKLPGYAIPIEYQGDAVTEFLLVPYQGACIHVPPPPPNQIIYVRIKDGSKIIRETYAEVWVTGILSIDKQESSFAESSYLLN
ncbi:MAG: DUF3299 domain-containing protein, partial [Gammaproteobacteria bacterium]|nr:DUF3299 domain-containing protein [Gammaproteobacteria bacterium]